MTTERKDPFDQLIDACNVALAFVSEKETTASEAAKKRTEQRVRIEKALVALTGGKQPAMKGTGTTNPNLICPNCGNHYASKAHRAACKSPEPEAANDAAPLAPALAAGAE